MSSVAGIIVVSPTDAKDLAAVAAALSERDGVIVFKTGALLRATDLIRLFTDLTITEAIEALTNGSIANTRPLRPGSATNRAPIEDVLRWREKELESRRGTYEDLMKMSDELGLDDDPAPADPTETK